MRVIGSQGRRQLREIGGGKIKIRGAKLKTSVERDPNFHYSWIGLRLIFSENQVISKKKKKKKVFAEIRRLFRAEITNLNVFFGQKQAISIKKVFAEIRRFFLAEITYLNVFSGQKQVISKKKGLRRYPKAFSGRNHKFKRFFRPKTALFAPKKIPWGARNKSGGQKRKSGGNAPPPPPPPRWRRACRVVCIHVD